MLDGPLLGLMSIANQFDWRVDEGLDMNLVESVAERNGHPNWEARVEFLRLFRRGKFLSISRNTIEQIVQQEWIDVQT